jgi:hypothetical protein
MRRISMEEVIMGNRNGRPSKLTPEVEKEFVGLVKAGSYIETVCAVVGIGRSTYYDWMKKANDSLESISYTRFRDEVRKAQAWAEARDVVIVKKHADKNWRAAAWLLERKYPQRWGRRKHQKKGKVPAKPVVSPVNISPEHTPMEDRMLHEHPRYYDYLEPEEWEDHPRVEEIEKESATLSTAEIEFLVKKQFYPANSKKNPPYIDKFI